MARPKKYCTIEGCNNVHYGRGLCRHHWNQYFQQRKTCLRSGCNKKAKREGLCLRHAREAGYTHDNKQQLPVVSELTPEERLDLDTIPPQTNLSKMQSLSPEKFVREYNRLRNGELEYVPLYGGEITLGNYPPTTSNGGKLFNSNGLRRFGGIIP